MKNYLIIENKNLIEEEDLFLIGSSTKRDDDTKIGMFGSGWKYALAKLVRDDLSPYILSGQREIHIDYDIVLHRNSPKRVLTINGAKTSITSEMGFKWSLWMAIREIVSNALDEGDYKLHTFTLGDNINEKSFIEEQKENNKSKVIIPMNTELNNIIMNFNDYFAFDRTPYFECEFGKIYTKNKKSHLTIYRKGIRCYDKHIIDSYFDFDFNNLDINESRVTTVYDIQEAITTLFSYEIPESILNYLFLDDTSFMDKVKESLNSDSVPIKDKKYLKNKLHKTPLNDHLISYISAKVKEGYEVFPLSFKEILGMMAESKEKTLLVPNSWYKHLRNVGIIKKRDDIETEGYPEGFYETDSFNFYPVYEVLKLFNLDTEVNLKTCILSSDFEDSFYHEKDNTVYFVEKNGEIKVKNRNNDVVNVIVTHVFKRLSFNKINEIIKKRK